MTSVTVIGMQWGDEGKGKIVDWLARWSDVVVRFQGGNNAGHTLEVDNQVYKLSTLPSGILRSKTLCLIGNGTVIDPWALSDEITEIRKRGISVSPDNLRIADNVCLVLPVHKELDMIRESSLGSNVKIGTTLRGIGACYEDKVGRRAIHLADLADKNTLEERVDNLLSHHNALRQGFGKSLYNREDLLEALQSIATEIIPYATSVYDLLSLSRGNILFEGAQGFCLDIDHGTYPYVTSSSVLGEQRIGVKRRLHDTDHILGVLKTYATRVGSGPFPTEIFDQYAEQLQSTGKEYGTVTGRKRRCGWFDAVLARQALQIAGASSFVLTKLDILDSFKTINICTGYELDGKKIDYLPTLLKSQNSVSPIYETLPGWEQSTKGVTEWNQLPSNAMRYINHIQDILGLPLSLVSTSPQRDDVIVVNNPFA
jgi:adenylosuccinate synthase